MEKLKQGEKITIVKTPKSKHNPTGGYTATLFNKNNIGQRATFRPTLNELLEILAKNYK